MKQILILFFISSTLFSNTIKNCNETYQEAWRLFSAGHIKKAEKEMDTCILSNEMTENWMNVLKAKIYLQRNENKKVIEVLKNTKYRVIEEFKYKKVYTNSKVIQNDIKLLYLHMLLASGYANLNLSNCKESINDFSMYLNEFKNPNVLANRGLCYAKLKQYKKSIQSLKEAYSMNIHSPLKEGISYNIAAIYASTNDTNKTLEWLKEPLNKDYALYKKEIDNDKDFDDIRNNTRFLELLSKYEY